MMEKCNLALEQAGYKPVTSKVTILKDLEGIENDFPEAVIVKRKIGRNLFYEYEDKTFSIYNIPLNDDEMAQLAQTISILSKFEGMPNFDWIDDLIEHFKSTLHIPSTRETIVAFDENYDLKGRNWFAKLFSAIASQQALEIKYKPFDKEVITYLFHPYLLKQYNNRWFLFGCEDGYTSITNLPLDRIVEISPATIAYRPNTEIDFQEYFNEMVGVSRRGSEISKVLIKVENSRYPYIETKPLHCTQRVISREGGATVIQIEVIINRELKQLLLSYGSDLTVVSPDSLKEEMQADLMKNLEKYQFVHIN
jgi:predicted DNA-binding transcriptional regulator YafY